MKQSPSVLIPCLVALGLASAADAPSRATTNATTNGTAGQIQQIICTPRPGDGIWSWYYNSRSDGPYSCTLKNDDSEWSMFNAYRSGGTEGVHWKYTSNANDGECLNNWKYYSSDGHSLLGTVNGRTTTLNDSRRWCALPVYRSGGVFNKQWGDCWCQFGRARD